MNPQPSSTDPVAEKCVANLAAYSRFIKQDGRGVVPTMEFLPIKLREDIQPNELDTDRIRSTVHPEFLTRFVEARGVVGRPDILNLAEKMMPEYSSRSLLLEKNVHLNSESTRFIHVDLPEHAPGKTFHQVGGSNRRVRDLRLISTSILASRLASSSSASTSTSTTLLGPSSWRAPVTQLRGMLAPKLRDEKNEKWKTVLVDKPTRLGTNDENMEDYALRYLYPFRVVNKMQDQARGYKWERNEQDLFQDSSRTMIKSLAGETRLVEDKEPALLDHRVVVAPSPSSYQRVQDLPLHYLRELASGLRLLSSDVTKFIADFSSHLEDWYHTLPWAMRNTDLTPDKLSVTQREIRSDRTYHLIRSTIRYLYLEFLFPYSNDALSKYQETLTKSNQQHLVRHSSVTLKPHERVSSGTSWLQLHRASDLGNDDDDEDQEAKGEQLLSLDGDGSKAMNDGQREELLFDLYAGFAPLLQEYRESKKMGRHGLFFTMPIWLMSLRATVDYVFQKGFPLFFKTPLGLEILRQMHDRMSEIFDPHGYLADMPLLRSHPLAIRIQHVMSWRTHRPVWTHAYDTSPLVRVALSKPSIVQSKEQRREANQDAEASARPSDRMNKGGARPESRDLHSVPLSRPSPMLKSMRRGKGSSLLRRGLDTARSSSQEAMWDNDGEEEERVAAPAPFSSIATAATSPIIKTKRLTPAAQATRRTLELTSVHPEDEFRAAQSADKAADMILEHLSQLRKTLQIPLAAQRVIKTRVSPIAMHQTVTKPVVPELKSQENRIKLLNMARHYSKRGGGMTQSQPLGLTTMHNDL